MSCWLEDPTHIQIIFIYIYIYMVLLFSLYYSYMKNELVNNFDGNSNNQKIFDFFFFFWNLVKIKNFNFSKRKPAMRIQEGP